MDEKKGVLRLNLRTRVEEPKGSGQWKEAVTPQDFPVAQTAILLCDMWDKHWCQGANERLAKMLPRMNEVVQFARAKGVQIIHAPSDTMKFYADSPQRKRAQAAPKVQPPPAKKLCAACWTRSTRFVDFLSRTRMPYSATPETQTIAVTRTELSPSAVTARNPMGLRTTGPDES